MYKNIVIGHFLFTDKILDASVTNKPGKNIASGSKLKAFNTNRYINHVIVPIIPISTMCFLGALNNIENPIVPNPDPMLQIIILNKERLFIVSKLGLKFFENGKTAPAMATPTDIEIHSNNAIISKEMPV